MKGQPCGVMPGKTNMGKEANPMKDDNGMNKQNNDTVAPEVNDNSGTDSLKGPWMDVTPRRKPRNDGKDANGKGSTSKANGSRFDTLRQVDENFGRNERDANTEHVHNHIRSSFVANNAKGLGPKVWSKSQKPKIADRTSLHDTSIRKIQRQQVLVRQKYYNKVLCNRNLCTHFIN
ncbi:unnamed protein product [Prunus armeniaca]|uniref:Uncharacterized protein n=1 Tax=Prunus armeniaca TaxID=36596 RepID=A0A6J5TWK4_PRUAR|nr:unnamed protein product [Prunus armeniaca]